MNTVVISIITAAITAFLTTIIKSYVDQYNYKAKLQKDLEFEQEKAIRSTINKYKGHLIDAMSSLHNRLKFIAREDGYCNLKSNNTKDEKIMESTIYRFLSTFAYIHLMKSELIHFDPTKAYNDDLIMLKFFRILPLIFQDKDLEDGFSKVFDTKSLIQRNEFESSYQWLIEDKAVIGYYEFVDKYTKNKSKFLKIEKYFSDLNPKDVCTRWDRVFTFHLFLMTFLNKFGFDFQKNDESKMKKYISRQGQFNMFKNIELHLVNKFKMNEIAEVKKMMKIAKYYI